MSEPERYSKKATRCDRHGHKWVSSEYVNARHHEKVKEIAKETRGLPKKGGVTRSRFRPTSCTQVRHKDVSKRHNNHVFATHSN